MLTTLALSMALSLAPGQGGTLKLTNDRATYGQLGATRPDFKFLPGDLFFFHFDIENLQMDKEGKVQYSISMSATDTNGKSIFKQDPRDMEMVNYLGGTS